MSIRVCTSGHLTGFLHCPQCGADAVRLLGDRQRPISRHELPKAAHECYLPAKTAADNPPPFKQWRIWRWARLKVAAIDRKRKAVKP